MPAAADGEPQLVRAGEANGIDHVGGAEAAGDHSRTAHEHAVVEAAHLVVARIGIDVHVHPEEGHVTDRRHPSCPG